MRNAKKENSQAKNHLVTSPNGRVASLDVLRGFSMFWIIGADAVVRSLPAVKDAPMTRFLASQFEHRP